MRKRKNSKHKGSLTVMASSPSLDLKQEVLNALEDDQFDWRTVGGLAKALGIGEQEIVGILDSLSDQVVRTNNGDGQSLFTTRSHYEKTHGFGDKLLSALADKVVA